MVKLVRVIPSWLLQLKLLSCELLSFPAAGVYSKCTEATITHITVDGMQGHYSRLPIPGYVHPFPTPPLPPSVTQL